MRPTLRHVERYDEHIRTLYLQRDPALLHLTDRLLSSWEHWFGLLPAPTLIERAGAFITLWREAADFLTAVAGASLLSPTVSERFKQRLRESEPHLALLRWWTHLEPERPDDEFEWAFAVCRCFGFAVGVGLHYDLFMPLVAYGGDPANGMAAHAVQVAVTGAARLMPSWVLAAARDYLSWQGTGASPLLRELRLQTRPQGTGRNPEYEHEVAETDMDLPEDDEGARLALADFVSGSEADISEQVASRDAVERLLTQAKGKTRQILQLLLEGNDVHDVARLVGTTPNSVYVLLHKFRRKISR